MKQLPGFCLGLLLPLSAMGQAPDANAPQPASNAPQPAPVDAKRQEKLNELLMRVQDEIELDDALRGIAFTGIRLVDNPQGQGQIMQLQGRLFDPSQKAPLKQLVENVLQNDQYWWVGNGPLPVSTETMQVRPGDRRLAARFQGMALQDFWKGKYAQADEAFFRALAEAPVDDVLRYWRVITALAQGQTERAKMKLAPLLKLYPLGSRTPMIAAALERLQGPLRWKLMSLENEVLASM